MANVPHFDGHTELKASHLNALVAAAAKANRQGVGRGLRQFSSSSGTLIEADPSRTQAGLWAKLLSEASGWYAWREQQQQPDGTWIDHPCALSGTVAGGPAGGPARATDGTTGLTGQIVWIRRSAYDANTGGKCQEWTFEARSTAVPAFVGCRLTVFNQNVQPYPATETIVQLESSSSPPYGMYDSSHFLTVTPFPTVTIPKTGHYLLTLNGTGLFTSGAVGDGANLNFITTNGSIYPGMFLASRADNYYAFGTPQIIAPFNISDVAAINAGDTFQLRASSTGHVMSLLNESLILTISKIG